VLLPEITICVLNLIPTQTRTKIGDVGGRHLLEAMQINSTVTSFVLVSMSPPFSPQLMRFCRF